MPKSLFIAAGHDGLRMFSADGRSWLPAELGKESEVYRAAAFGNGRCLAVGTFGGANLLATTTDAKTWNVQKQDAKYAFYVRGLAFGNGTFLGIGGDPGSVGLGRPFVMRTTDGVKWDGPTEIAGKFILRRIVFGDKRWVGVGDRGRRATSTDGLKWEDVARVKALDTLTDIAFGSGLFVGVGLHGLRMTTKDGLDWTAPIRGDEGEHLNSIVWAKDRFVAIGQGATYFSPDGTKWERQANKDAPLTMAYGDGIFLGPRWKGRIMRSTDAVRWEEVIKVEQHIEGVAFGQLNG